jgi:KDO2-lipid IV(A) lauroyltransferase
VITLLGWLWWWVIPIRKRVAIANYRSAFPDRDPSELRRTVGEMVWSYIELACGKRAMVHGAELASEGGLCLAGHLSAWDLCLISAAQEVPISIFVRPPTNPLLAWWIKRERERAGLELLSPRGSAISALRALKRGRVVIFVQDQRHNQGIPVPFFGRPALTSRGFGLLAARTGAPLLGATQWRDEDGQHHIKVERLDPTLPADAEAAADALTTFSQAFYEERIRRNPHSWLWLHDRWRAFKG